jgi:hypothetical protein
MEMTMRERANLEKQVIQMMADEIADMTVELERCRNISKRRQESRVRRKGRSLGYQVRKSREWKHVPNLDNMGGYMLIDDRGFCMLGSRYDVSLDEIEDYLARAAA